MWDLSLDQGLNQYPYHQRRSLKHWLAREVLGSLSLVTSAETLIPQEARCLGAGGEDWNISLGEQSLAHNTTSLAFPLLSQPCPEPQLS